MRVACSELPPAHPSRSGSLSKLQEKERTLGRGAFFLSVERLLTREEREADQDADQVGSATAETVRVVGFHARRETAVRERKLEPEPGARVPGVRVIRAWHVNAGNPQEGTQVETLANAIAGRLK